MWTALWINAAGLGTVRPHGLALPARGREPLPTDEQIGARIRRARLEAGFSSEAAFAKALGFSQPTVSRLESGNRRIGAGELVAIAELLNRPPQHFLEDDATLVFFRDSGESLSAENDAAFRWLEDFARRVEALREFTPKLAVPVSEEIELASPSTWEEAQNAAGQARSRLGLGSGPAPDMFALVEAAGCLVVVQPFVDAHFDAMYVPRPLGIALVNGATAKTAARQRFTLAHELFHHLFDKGRVVVDLDLYHFKERRDQLANIFAAHFLAPRQGISAELERRFKTDRPESAEHAYWLAYAYGLSFEAMCYHLKNLELASAQATVKWREAPTKYLAARLGILGETQYLKVTNRWPTEFVQRLQYALHSRVITREQLFSHLREDQSAAKELVAAASG
jgi:Zn-dependent peptidase ImmA (M78 family)/transcriptional regulator with XRE-family HTH domain